MSYISFVELIFTCPAFVVNTSIWYIIEGVIQGFLYLQEYSRMTITRPDLKGSNILLDDEMKQSKISNFGMARILRKDDHEVNTGRIVGT
jgi:serine/threonine protein kinase